MRVLIPVCLFTLSFLCTLLFLSVISASTPVNALVHDQTCSCTAVASGPGQKTSAKSAKKDLEGRETTYSHAHESCSCYVDTHFTECPAGTMALEMFKTNCKGTLPNYVDSSLYQDEACGIDTRAVTSWRWSCGVTCDVVRTCARVGY